MTSRTLYSCTMSLDGFMAGPGGDMQWLHKHPLTQTARHDAVEAVLAHEPDDAGVVRALRTGAVQVAPADVVLGPRDDGAVCRTSATAIVWARPRSPPTVPSGVVVTPTIMLLLLTGRLGPRDAQATRG